MGNVPLQPCCTMREHDDLYLEKKPRFPPCSAAVSREASPRGKALVKSLRLSVSPLAEGHASSAKRHSKTRSPKERRLDSVPEEQRSSPQIAQKVKSTFEANARVERSRRGRQEKLLDAVERQKKAGSPRTHLKQEVQPEKISSPLEEDAVLTNVPSKKAAEIRLNKEHKEKRKKRKEAGKGNFSDRTSDDGSTRCQTLGAQVENGCPTENDSNSQQGGAHFAPDGTDSVTTEACSSATSEGLSSCNKAYGAWEPAAEAPCSSDGTETLTEQAWLCPLDEQEQSKDGREELISAKTHNEGCLLSQALLPLSLSDVGEHASETGSIPVDLISIASPGARVHQAAPVMFDLAEADGEIPALAAEFTAQLSEVDLGHFAEPLARLGVEAVCDVAYISDKELSRVGMNLVQRRKLRGMVPSGKDEGDCKDILSVETKMPYVDSGADTDSGYCSEASTADAISNDAGSVGGAGECRPAVEA